MSREEQLPKYQYIAAVSTSTDLDEDHDSTDDDNSKIWNQWWNQTF